MAETLETATTTDLALDYDVPKEFELDSNILVEIDPSILVEIDPDVDFEWLSADVAFTTFALGAEDGDWACEACEVYVKVVPYPSPDAEMPVVPDLA